MADFKIEGLDAVLAKMKRLPQELRVKGVRAGLRKGANVVRDAARAGALRIDRTQTPLRIADNIAVQYASRTSKRTGVEMFRVGVRGGAKAYGNTKQNRAKKRVGATYETGGSTFYWRFVELGTSRSRAQPFMLPALEDNVQKVADVTVAEIEKALDRILKKGR